MLPRLCLRRKHSTGPILVCLRKQIFKLAPLAWGMPTAGILAEMHRHTHSLRGTETGRSENLLSQSLANHSKGKPILPTSTNPGYIQRLGNTFFLFFFEPLSSLQPISKLIQSTLQCIAMTSPFILRAPSDSSFVGIW